MTTPTTCTVYFDGACPGCRTEIAHYRRQRGAEAIVWVDASSCDAAALGPDADKSLLLSRTPRSGEAPMRIMAGGAWSACAAVGGKLANPKGSCVAWPKKAWPARGSQVVPSGYPDTFPAIIYQQEI